MRFSTSGGPGGQHANKAATRSELTWNLKESRALDEVRRALLVRSLSSRLDAEGSLRLSSDTHRSQMRNRQDVRDRLAKIVAEALEPPKTRTKTKPTKASAERRLRAKKMRGGIKDLRRPPDDD